MITVVLWWWGDRYSVEHLLKMRSMLRRHLSFPHEIKVITDRDKKDLPAGTWKFDVKNTLRKRIPDRVCMRRMWLYSEEAGALGERLLQLDLDVVLTDSIDPIVDRPEPFVIWRGDSTVKPNRPHGWAYNATVMLLNPGARKDVWDQWLKDPKKIYRESEEAGWDPKVNSDQAIATYLLEKQPPAYWTQADGIHAYRGFAGPDGMKSKELPAGCRIVSFHGRGGKRHPGSAELQERTPWIKEHWR
jgi:hypothetical protein